MAAVASGVARPAGISSASVSTTHFISFVTASSTTSIYLIIATTANTIVQSETSSSRACDRARQLKPGDKQ